MAACRASKQQTAEAVSAANSGGAAGPDPSDFMPPPSLVSYARDGRCALFVGAGLSRPAGYPGWSQLMTEIVREVIPASLQSQLTDLLNQGKFADVADQCRHVLGSTRFFRCVRSLLGSSAKPPEATHRPIVDTPWKCIVTTNFDTLLEDAYTPYGAIAAFHVRPLGHNSCITVRCCSTGAFSF